MFLVVPKSKNSTVQASQSVAKIKNIARVPTACDRCRVKKVKCSGNTPCLRCMEDEIICTVSRQVPGDSKAASIEYIRSMETKQSQLIKALTVISRHVRQPVCEGDLREILETVRKCGFDFERVGDQFKISNNVTEISQANLAKRPYDDAIDEPEDTHSTIKRKQRHCISHELGISAGLVGLNGLTHLDGENTCYQRDAPNHQLASDQPFDNYWDLDAYLDAVAAPFLPPPSLATQPATIFRSEQEHIMPCQYLSDPPNWVQGGIYLPDYTTVPNRQAMNSQSDSVSTPAKGAESALPSQNTLNHSDLNSTVWWDPASLADTSLSFTPP